MQNKPAWVWRVQAARGGQGLPRAAWHADRHRSPWRLAQPPVLHTVDLLGPPVQPLRDLIQYSCMATPARESMVAWNTS